MLCIFDIFIFKGPSSPYSLFWVHKVGNPSTAGEQGKLKTNLCTPTLSEMAAGKSLKIPFFSLNRKNHDGRLFICIFQKFRGGGGWGALWTPCILCSDLPILDKHQEQTRPCPLQNCVTQQYGQWATVHITHYSMYRKTHVGISLLVLPSVSFFRNYPLIMWYNRSINYQNSLKKRLT